MNVTHGFHKNIAVKTLPSNSSKDLEDPFSSIEETLNQAVSDLHLKSSTAYDSSSYCQPSRARVEKEMEILARRKDVVRCASIVYYEKCF